MKKILYHFNYCFIQEMSGCKGFGKHSNKRRYGNNLETGKPFPPPGGFYVMWQSGPPDDRYERFPSTKSEKL